MTRKRKQDAELANLSKKLAKWNDRDLLAEAFGKQFALELMKKWPGETHVWSKCIASMCMNLDKKKDCRKLLIEWFHEHYGAFVIEESLEDIHDTIQLLRALQHTAKDPVESAGDCEAWYEIDNVFVMQDQHTRRAVIIEDKPFYKLHVRRLKYQWDDGSKRKYGGCISLCEMRKRKWKLQYGDCRDEGYVITYETFMTKKVDRVASYWPELEYFLSSIGYLLATLQGTQTRRLGEIHAKE